MANSRDERHRYGQHYTPREVARLLAAFAIRRPGDLVLDPSCGDGRLLEEALGLKNRLAAHGDSPRLAREVFGVERSPSAGRLARRTGACVAVADFFDVEPGARLNRTTSLPLEFDAVIGNPPYIRHEVVGSTDKRRIEACLVRDRVASLEVFWPRWSGRSDIYVYFFAHSIRFLKSRGRLVFLTAGSWLDVGYGAALREFLLANFRVIAVIESGCESFFEDASINTAITVLEREPDPRARDRNAIRFVRFNRALTEILGEDSAHKDGQPNAAVQLASDIERGVTSSTGERYRIRVIGQSELLPATTAATTKAPQLVARAVAQGWGKYLRADDVFFKVIERGSSRLRSLSKMASVRFGVKTGANEFFYVKEDGGRTTDDGQRAKGEGRSAKSKGQGAKGKGQGTKGEGQGARGEGRSAKGEGALLALAEVASVRRGVTTGANEFFYLSRADTPTETRAGGRRSQAKRSTNGLTVVRDSEGKLREIESELLSPVVFSLKEVRGVLLERVASQRMLFNCPLAADKLSGTRALEYIKSGERAGYDQRPTCASRDPWYSVARDMQPAPLIFPSKVGERWVVALNRAGVFEDKKLYGIFPNGGVSELALAALLNSTWARYYAEITCRQMTGAQAIADIDVAVAEQILLPDPRKLPASIKKKLEAAILELSRRPVYSVFEEVQRPDRRRLDMLTLEAIGFCGRSEQGVVDELYQAVSNLVKGRLAKSRAGQRT
ncbi:MAG: N-6 DNA methylase [Acidobacteriota bacterium]